VQPASADVQGVAGAAVDVTPGDYLKLDSRQITGSAADIAAGELTWFAVEVAE
jgi:hypothetical protein